MSLVLYLKGKENRNTTKKETTRFKVLGAKVHC